MEYCTFNKSNPYGFKMNFFPLLAPILNVPDSGPVYRETTDLSHFIVEPWNAFSSLTFLIPAVVFLWKLRGRYADYAFLIYFCIPMLIIGGLGSTFFHAFRSSGWLLAMDVLPIVFLVLGISIWIWLKVLNQKWMLFPILVVFFGLTYFSQLFLTGQDRISASYVVRGAMLLIPCFWYLSKTHFQHVNYLITATFSFALALVFRYADEKIYISFMPWGTHWLWHISTAIGAWFLGEYLIRNTKQEQE